MFKKKRSAALDLEADVSKPCFRKFGPFSNYLRWLFFALKSGGLLKFDTWFSCWIYFPDSGSLLSMAALLSSQSLCFLKLPDLLPELIPLINVWIRLLIWALWETLSCWKQVWTCDLAFCEFVWLFSAGCCSITLLKAGLTGHGCTTCEV